MKNFVFLIVGLFASSAFADLKIGEVECSVLAIPGAYYLGGKTDTQVADLIAWRVRPQNSPDLPSSFYDEPKFGTASFNFYPAVAVTVEVGQNLDENGKSKLYYFKMNGDVNFGGSSSKFKPSAYKSMPQINEPLNISINHDPGPIVEMNCKINWIVPLN